MACFFLGGFPAHMDESGCSCRVQGYIGITFDFEGVLLAEGNPVYA